MSAVERFVCDYCGAELSEDSGWFFISEESAIAHTNDHDSEHCIREDFELDFCCKKHLMFYIDEHLCEYKIGEMPETTGLKSTVIKSGFPLRTNDFC